MKTLDFLNRERTLPLVKRTWESVIKTGKSNPEYQKAGEGPKYKDPNDLENSGSINLIDANILYNLTKEVSAGEVFEIGTWFGTSAAIMSEAGAMVSTCDKHNFLPQLTIASYGIEFYNMSSHRALSAQRLDYDMVFVDGKLDKRDAKILVKRSMRCIFALHDFVDDKKGVRAYKTLKGLFKGTLVKPAKGSSIALYFKPGDFNNE